MTDRQHESGSGPTDLQLFARALGLGLLGVAAVGLVAALASAERVKTHAAKALTAIEPPSLAEPQGARERLEAAPLTPELRRKGHHECYPHDPIGLGPYAPYRNLILGRIAIPQQGGHTDDFGYDVVVHFHGHTAVRKTLVQVARGVAFVGIDKGLGSGRYSGPFKNPQLFPQLRASIEKALRRHSGDERAHIRHLALSAWSAGYGAVNEILKLHADEVDGVILLDGLHAAWSREYRRHDGSIQSLSARNITPTFDFARRALDGEKIFIWTHSRVTPRYPSTAQTANLLLDELGLVRARVDDDPGDYGQDGAVDAQGLHVWSFRGGDQRAHCAHIAHIARAVRDILEEEWDTPPMDRNVPPTPAPKLGGGSDPAEEATMLQLVAADEAPDEPTADPPGEAHAAAGGDVDRAGLEPRPLRATEPGPAVTVDPSGAED